MGIIEGEFAFVALGVGSSTGEIITPELNHTVHSHVLSYSLKMVCQEVSDVAWSGSKNMEKIKKGQGDGAVGLDNQQFLI